MKMGNVAKEPRLSDLLFSIDMERQHDEVSALLDNLPPGELESSLSNIDLDLFLGENGADIPVDFLAEEGISFSSCDSDEFKSFFNGKKTIKTEPVSPDKNVQEKKNKKGLWNKKNRKGKRVILEDESREEAFNVVSPRKSIKVENNIKYECVSSYQQDDKSTICNSYKKKSRKRKNSEYSKKKTKINKNIKIVIKYKENPSEEPKAVVVSASTSSPPADASSPRSDNARSSSHPFDFSFDDISDSFSTSIAEKVKTRTRNKNCSPEPVVHHAVNKEPASETINKEPGSETINKEPVSETINKETASETIVKQVEMSPLAAEKSSPLKKDSPCLSPRSVSYHINKTKETIQKKLLSIKKLAASSNSASNVLKNSCNNVPNLSLIPCNDVLGITDNFINKNKKTVINNNNVIASKIKSFHDYSKNVPANNKVVKSDKELSQNSPYLVPNECKSISLRSDTNHTSPTLKARKASGEYIELVSSVQESSDVPVSMAEVEIASFEDASDVSMGNQSPYSLRKSHFSDSSPKKPAVLLTPISSKRLLNSENLRNRHCSTESENSSRGYHSADSLSPSPAKASHMLGRPRKSGLKSSFEPNSQSELLPLDEIKEGNDSRKLPFDNRKAIEERRVMYVGKIPNGFTEEILLQRFSMFGEIENIQIKVRESEAQNDCVSVADHEYGDWNLMSSNNGIDKWKKMYGFVTFKKHVDVARAIEEGQKWWPELKLNFGGRREFVKVNYSDLDGNFAEKTGYASRSNDDFDFARELKAAQLRRGLAYK